MTNLYNIAYMPWLCYGCSFTIHWTTDPWHIYSYNFPYLIATDLKGKKRTRRRKGQRGGRIEEKDWTEDWDRSPPRERRTMWLTDLNIYLTCSLAVPARHGMLPAAVTTCLNSKLAGGAEPLAEDHM